jgi:hypothetical protein
MAAHRAAEFSAAGFAVDIGVAHFQHLPPMCYRLASRRVCRTWESTAVANLRRINHTAHSSLEIFGAT